MQRKLLLLHYFNFSKLTIIEFQKLITFVLSFENIVFTPIKSTQLNIVDHVSLQPSVGHPRQGDYE